jgi:hypothetical protein
MAGKDFTPRYAGVVNFDEHEAKRCFIAVPAARTNNKTFRFAYLMLMGVSVLVAQKHCCRLMLLN